MSLRIDITAETEAILREQAAAAGQSPEAYVLGVLTERLAEVEPVRTTAAGNGNDWKSTLQECIELHPVVTTFVDDSRESIYPSRDE